MKDNLLVITKIKKTIVRLDKITDNFSRNEVVLRDNIRLTMYQLLETSYMANLIKKQRLFYQKEVLVKIKMLDFYLVLAHSKKLLTAKQLESISAHLLETFILVQAWIKSQHETI